MLMISNRTMNQAYEAIRKIPIRRGASLLILIGITLAGCAGKSLSPRWEGPPKIAVAKTANWEFMGTPGRQLVSDHYSIYTTIADQELQGRLITVMEGALEQYRKLAPGVQITDRPMPCYIFATRKQWADYTRANTGPDASIYLQINRGGYCVKDVYAAYFLGQSGTSSVASHEGWHQFVARHFAGRIPPFLEEGIATLFEDIEWVDDLPRWQIGVNRTRVQSLRKAVQGKHLIPLKELITIHAGEVVNRSGNRIEAFYAQDWAFALFLWQADQQKYRPALQRMLSDIASGKDPQHQGLILPAVLGWRPATVQPLLERYLEMDLASIEKAYLRFVKTVAFDEYNDQWAP